MIVIKNNVGLFLKGFWWDRLLGQRADWGSDEHVCLVCQPNDRPRFELLAKLVGGTVEEVSP